jgi:hypothetical protein
MHIRFTPAPSLCVCVDVTNNCLTHQNWFIVPKPPLNTHIWPNVCLCDICSYSKLVEQDHEQALRFNYDQQQEDVRHDRFQNLDRLLFEFTRKKDWISHVNR